MKNKKGISAIVATVLIILITVAAVTIIWAAIIPMIPGKYAFLAIMGLVNMTSQGVTPELTSLFLQNSLTTVSILGAISLGIVVPSLYYIRYNQPVI